MRILVVEDDALVADAIVRGLTHAGFTVDHAASAEAARAALDGEHFDLAVVDVGLPAMDGLTLLQGLRRRGQPIPILILTARDTLADKIRAFDQGADDFLMKPFEQAELAARCRALIRRSTLTPSGLVHLGALTIDLNGCQVKIDAQTVELTRREWLLLESLALNIGRIVTKERLAQALSGWEQDLTSSALETHISRLRGKLGDAVRIRAVRGLGYRLDEVGTSSA
jgi:DNA-binding response OmpR family regulator